MSRGPRLRSDAAGFGRAVLSGLAVAVVVREILAHMNQQLAQELDLLRLQVAGRQSIYLDNKGGKLLAQLFGLGRQIDMHAAPVLGTRLASYQSNAFEALERGDGGWLLRADTATELALGQAFLEPKRTQEAPLAARHAMREGSLFKRARERARHNAGEIANTVGGVFEE